MCALDAARPAHDERAHLIPPKRFAPWPDYNGSPREHLLVLGQTSNSIRHSATRKFGRSIRHRDIASQAKAVVGEERNEFQEFLIASTGRVLPLFGRSLFDDVPSAFAPVENVPVTPGYVIKMLGRWR